MFYMVSDVKCAIMKMLYTNVFARPCKALASITSNTSNTGHIMYYTSVIMRGCSVISV